MDKKEIKVIVAYGQGNGYGDGNEYAFFTNELHNVRPFKKGLNNAARIACRYGSIKVYESIGDFLGLHEPIDGNTLHCSKAIEKARGFKVLG